MTDAEQSALISDIQLNDSPAIERLYGMVCLGSFRKIALREVGASAEDVLSCAFMSALGTIQRRSHSPIDNLHLWLLGTVRNFLRMEVRRIQRTRKSLIPLILVDDATILVAQEHRIFGNGPESQAIANERLEIAGLALDKLLPREREILKRFYLDEQSSAEIRIAMDLTATQFRLLKSRAKASFGDIGKDLIGASLPPGTH